MANLIHDYSKPAKVNNLLLEAYSLLDSSFLLVFHAVKVRNILFSALKLLDVYLASDNLIPDDDE